MTGPGGTPQATASGGTESDKAAGPVPSAALLADNVSYEEARDALDSVLQPAPGGYLERLAEAERNVLSMALLWLNDQTVGNDTLADVIEAYADVLDSQEHNL